ncbi:hypothetical protein AB0H34_22455 [Saccharopolyspora shandongensis]|uniref:hypothetical protein n=1 Tax=Saccharopolyspora shandongensis TaxID=418495 RepID=UPI0033E2F754
MDRPLRGETPPGGKCDVKTLATASGITRAALYSTYLGLKEEFEQRCATDSSTEVEQAIGRAIGEGCVPE